MKERYPLMDQRGQEVAIWHDYGAKGGEVIGVPFLVTNRHYGLIFDNPSRTTIIPGRDGLTTWQAEVGDALSFFVVQGDVTDEIYCLREQKQKSQVENDFFLFFYISSLYQLKVSLLFGKEGEAIYHTN
jgi:hypothetical protein